MCAMDRMLREGEGEEGMCMHERKLVLDTKVGFRLVQIHAARHGRARWDLPLRLGEIYSRPLV